MRKQCGKTALLFLAVCIICQAQEINSEERTYAGGNGGSIAYGCASGDSCTSLAERVDVGDEADINAFPPKGNTRRGISEALVCNANPTSFNLVHAGAHDEMEWSGDTAISQDLGVEAGLQEMPGKTTTTTPFNRTKPSPANKGSGTGDRAIMLAAPCQQRDERDEPNLRSKDGTKPFANGPRIVAGRDEDGTSRTSHSLAPGGKQQASWGTGGAAMWIGGLMFALFWTVLLC